MQIKYTIYRVMPEDHQIEVRYYTDRLAPEDLNGRTDLALTLPVPTPTGKALHDFIMQYAPVAYLEMREAKLDGDPAYDMSAIEAEVGQEYTPVPSLDDLKAERMTQLGAEYTRCVMAGFSSSALGSPHRYKSDVISQIWLLGATVAQSDRAYECTDLATGVTARRVHTPQQLLQVLRDGAALAESYKDEYMSLVEQIQAATTQAELDAVPHMEPR